MDQRKVQPKLIGPKKSPIKAQWTKEKSNQNSMDQRKVQSKLNGPKKSPTKTQWTKEKSNQSSMDRRKVQSKLNGPKKRLKTAENCSLKKIRWQMFFPRVEHFCRTFPGLCFLRASSGTYFRESGQPKFFPYLTLQSFLPKRISSLSQ